MLHAVWLSSRRSRAGHHAYCMTKVFKFAQPAHSFSPISSRFSGFETVNGFGFCATLAAFFSLGSRGFTAMHAAHIFPFDSWSTALFLGPFRLGLALVALDSPAKCADS